MNSGRFLLATLVAVAYAGCFVVITLGLPYAPPLRFAGGRALLAGVTLLAVSGISGRGLVPPRRLRPWIPVLGAILTIQYAAMFLSPDRAGAGLSSVLANTGPIFLVILAYVVLRERMTVRSVGALLLGVAGVSLIAWPAMSTGEGTGFLAVILPLGVAVGAAAGTVVLKRLDAGEALLSVAAWQLILGALPLLLASALFENDATAWTPALVGALTFLALPGTALALGVWYWLVQREPVSRLAALMFLVPVAGLALAWAVFGETVSGGQAAGVALALVGIPLASGMGYRDSRPTRSPGAVTSATLTSSHIPARGQATDRTSAVASIDSRRSTTARRRGGWVTLEIHCSILALENSRGRTTSGR